jgi:hypothetical protein
MEELGGCRNDYTPPPSFIKRFAQMCTGFRKWAVGFRARRWF